MARHQVCQVRVLELQHVVVLAVEEVLECCSIMGEQKPRVLLASRCRDRGGVAFEDDHVAAELLQLGNAARSSSSCVSA